MCKVNGEGRVRFGAREWIGISSIMLASVVAATGANHYVVTLMIANHADQRDIHQSRDEKDAHYVTHRELEAHASSPHGGILAAFDRINIELAKQEQENAIQNYRLYLLDGNRPTVQGSSAGKLIEKGD